MSVEMRSLKVESHQTQVAAEAAVGPRVGKSI